MVLRLPPLPGDAPRHMKIVVPGCPKSDLRVTCAACGCVFDLTKKECRRRKIETVLGHRFDYDAKCPFCKEINHGVCD
jgi:hypothetical protein